MTQRYELNFIGKSKAKQQYYKQIQTQMLQNIEHNSKLENKNSSNVYISGDNLYVLKHLKKQYTNKIKCIYVDPPYNTGNKFIYNDKFKQKSIDKHSSWLSFMYPRLQLARDLLSDDGVIFISIGDDGCYNLKLLCDEIFGQQNFIRKHHY